MVKIYSLRDKLNERSNTIENLNVPMQMLHSYPSASISIYTYMLYHMLFTPGINKEQLAC